MTIFTIVLGTMGIFQGIALLIGGPGITYLPESFSQFGHADFLGLQSPVWVLIILALLAHYAMSYTRVFRQFYYIGSNAKAANLSGINVQRLQILSFVLMGTLADLAGILYASRIAAATSTLGVGAELQAITAVILGGASLAGGRGTILGSDDRRLFHGVDEKRSNHFEIFIGMAGDRIGCGPGCRRCDRLGCQPATGAVKI